MQYPHPIRPVVRIWVTVTGADSISRAPWDDFNHFIRNNVLSCAEDVAHLGLASMLAPRGQEYVEIVKYLRM